MNFTKKDDGLPPEDKSEEPKLRPNVPIERRQQEAIKALLKKAHVKDAHPPPSSQHGAEFRKVESYVKDANKPLQPKLFDAYKMVGPDDFVILNGTRRTGKSWLDRYLLHSQRRVFRCGEVFTNTPMNGFWQKHFPDWKVFTGWQPGVVAAILEEQKKVVEIWRRFPEKVNPFRVMVLDDCANTLTHSAELEDLAAYGRHFKISVHVITQHPQKLPPLVRSNADVVAVFPLHSGSALETLRADYLSTMDKDLAMDALTTLCWKEKKESQALIIMPRVGNSIHERAFYISAPDPGPFQVGCREYWQRLSTTPTPEEVTQWEEEEAASSKGSTSRRPESVTTQDYIDEHTSKHSGDLPA